MSELTQAGVKAVLMRVRRVRNLDFDVDGDDNIDIDVDIVEAPG